MPDLRQRLAKKNGSAGPGTPDPLAELRAEQRLRSGGWSRDELDSWSWPVFWLRFALAEQQVLTDALLQAGAVWNGDKMQPQLEQLTQQVNDLMGLAARAPERGEMSWEQLKKAAGYG